jgi:hypothetical protein
MATLKKHTSLNVPAKTIKWGKTINGKPKKSMNDVLNFVEYPE